MSSRTTALTLASALALLPLAACGDDGGDGAELPAGAVVAGATDSLEFEPDALSATAGEVVLGLENEGSLPHTLVIEDREDDLKLSVSGSGDADSGTIELEAGEYVFYCDVSGHRAAGMEGTLTVE